ncbi:hypothetical protein C8R46DRAFT_1120775, partial [Mycena filopes]
MRLHLSFLFNPVFRVYTLRLYLGSILVQAGQLNYAWMVFFVITLVHQFFIVCRCVKLEDKISTQPNQSPTSSDTKNQSFNPSTSSSTTPTTLRTRKFGGSYRSIRQLQSR